MTDRRITRRNIQYTQENGIRGKVLKIDGTG
jgi:hypothetical protein